MFKLKQSLIIAVLLSIFLGAGLSFAQPSDIQGHWAETLIGKWVEKGLVSGYPDGSFKPDNSITRAEFVTLVNRSFGFTGNASQVPLNFTDVSSTDWFFNEVGKAWAAGYVAGYEDGTFRPEREISRQEAAALVSRLLKLKAPESKGKDVLAKFKDAQSIPQWSEGAVSAAVAGGYLAGYPDLTFRPGKSITRAEAVATLDRAKGAPAENGTAGKTFDQAGSYGPESGEETIAGDITIGAAGVTLRNITVNGNLVFSEGIGEGSVSLKNVTVTGETVIKGGGANSIELEDCKLGAVKINKKQGQVRVRASGRTSVANVKLESGAILEESRLNGDGFTNVTIVTIAGTAPVNSLVELAGDFQVVNVESPKTGVRVTRGKVDNLNVAENAGETTINIAAEAKVTTLTLMAAAKVTGQGMIETALIKANGAILEQKPGSIILAGGVAATIAGQEVKESTPVKTGGGGGTSSGAGGGGGETGAPKITAASVTVGGVLVNVDIDSAGLNGRVDLTRLPGESPVTSGTISVSKAATLTLTVQVGGLNIPVTQKLNAGENQLEAISLLGKIGKNEMTLDNLKQYFGGTVVLSGNLKDNTGNTANVSLTIFLPK